MDSPSTSTQDAMQNAIMKRENILSVYHTLKFSKENKDCFEIAGIERRSLALKYMTTKLS